MTDDQLYLSHARANARDFADCPAAKVGAVLITAKGPVNGANGPQDGSSCFIDGCVAVPAQDGKREYSRHLHAEMDALLAAAQLGIATNNADLYVTKAPCYDCMKFIARAGVRTVFIPAGSAVSPHVRELAERTGVAIKEVEVAE